MKGKNPQDKSYIFDRNKTHNVVVGNNNCFSDPHSNTTQYLIIKEQQIIVTKIDVMLNKFDLLIEILSDRRMPCKRRKVQ